MHYKQLKKQIFYLLKMTLKWLKWQNLKKLKLKENILLVCITRGAETEIPNGDSVFQPGDSVLVVAGGDQVILQLNDIFA